MRTFLQLLPGQKSLARLMTVNLGSSLAIYLLLEIWRPCYFLTDDNLSCGYPLLVEIGRHLKHGESPFVTQYLFGGHYNLLRDAGFIFWHPFNLLPSLLGDTWARFWIMDVIALLFLILTAVGFTLLTYSLREEFNLKISDGYLTFYTLSFLFSTFILIAAPSWLSIMGNQSALPWLALGILDKKALRGTVLIAVVAIHQVLGGYVGLTLSNTLSLSLFALGIAYYRRSFVPFCIWSIGNIAGLLVLSPLLRLAVDGYSHSIRAAGFPMEEIGKFSIPAEMFPTSFLFGNWTDVATRWAGDPTFKTLEFPYLSTLAACAAAWCLIPTLLSTERWSTLEVICLGIAGFMVCLICRPPSTAAFIQYIPVLKSLRWPFREVLQFQFFLHLLLVLRFQGQKVSTRHYVAIFSALVFLLPLPFSRVPTFNPLALDRQMLLSGKADAFWARVKTRLKPTDQLATIISYKIWESSREKVPFTLLGTANFPALFQVVSISGYTVTAPKDQVPLKTLALYHFGAYRVYEVDSILGERPQLKLITLESVDPLKITLSSGKQPAVDITNCLQP